MEMTEEKVLQKLIDNEMEKGHGTCIFVIINEFIEGKMI